MATSHYNEHEYRISADRTDPRSVQSPSQIGNIQVVAPPTATEDEIAAVVACLDVHLHHWWFESTGYPDENDSVADGWTIADRCDGSSPTDVFCAISSESRWKIAGRVDKQY